ncbi:hypothetical protein O5264_29375, partial [Escherichia coli]|nr:hypothetical protein [Escherichia coli]
MAPRSSFHCQRDWEVRDFHGTEYKTLRGSSYIQSAAVSAGRDALLQRHRAVFPTT